MLWVMVCGDDDHCHINKKKRKEVDCVGKLMHLIVSQKISGIHCGKVELHV